jgi:hypothetical protein
MVYRQFGRVSTGENAGQAGQKLEQVVNGSSSRRVGAEFLADADEDECWHEVRKAVHDVALLGRDPPA